MRWENMLRSQTGHFRTQGMLRAMSKDLAPETCFSKPHHGRTSRTHTQHGGMSQLWKA